MTVYVTRYSTTIDSYHTREDCPRLDKGANKIELDESHNLVSELEHCAECNGTVDFAEGGKNGGLLQKIQWLERLLGDDIDPQEYLPLDKHIKTCERSECPVCKELKSEVNHACY